MSPSANYHRHRFPAEIISHCVWLYFRFSLSYRDVEEVMMQRGVTVSYESIRCWCFKFGRQYARRIRQKNSFLGDRWHLDEVFIRINGKRQYLWRAVDQDGSVLDIMVQPRRNKAAAKRFFRKLLKGALAVPRRLVTDRLSSYASAHKDMMPLVDHHRNRWQNNRAENSHQPTRERERRMRRFKSPGQAQRFLSIYSQFCNFFRPTRNRLSAAVYREIMRRRFIDWQSIAGLVAPA